MTLLQSSVNPVFRQALQDAAQAAEMTDDALPRGLPSLGRRRRGGRPLGDDQFKVLNLVSVDGVLEWREDLQPIKMLRRGRRTRATSVDVVQQFPFVKLQPSDVTAFLDSLDRKLTPHQGFFHIDDLNTPVPAPANGNALVLIHGTFSDPQSFVQGLSGPFLKEARKQNRYGRNVFVYGHPTLAVGPLENAVDLAQHFHGSQANVDVIAHSRGGLVARWWFESVWRGSVKPGRAVLVGCPLGGTSLAAPPRIRSTFKFLTNLASAFGTISSAASAVAPIMTVVTGLSKLVSSFTSLMAHTPVTDAVMAMVPGLVAQSRVGNQPGLLLLRKHYPRNAPLDYHIVSASFKPDAISAWEFWKLFNVKRLASKFTDGLFDGPNDLVVDTLSMADFYDNCAIANANHLQLPPGSKIHHTNYFEQPEVITFLSNKLFSRN